MEFHLIRNGKQEGPFTVEELSQQGIGPESEVWAPGMADWMPASEVPELTVVLQRAEFEAAQQAARAAENRATTGQPYDPPVPPRHQDPPQTPRYAPTSYDQPRRKNGCLSWGIAGLILAILFVAMVMTCPDKAAHEQAIQEVTKEWVGDKVDENLEGITGVGGIFGDLINKALQELTGIGTEKIVHNFLDVKNYVVCSVGRISIGDNKDKIVSLGVFGHVFTFGKDDIEKAWMRAMDDLDLRSNSVQAPQIQMPQPAPDADDVYADDEDATDDRIILPDSVFGIEVPEGLDSTANELAKEAIRMAKEWAKQQIDKL